MWKNYFKIGWRNMWLGYWVTIINLSGLTIGMTSAFFILMWVQNEYSYNSYHKDAERIYRLKAFMTNGLAWETTPYLLGEEVMQQLEVEQLTRIIPNRYDDGPVITMGGQQLKEKNSATVDENWFEMFHYDFIQGSAEAFNSQPYGVILSESTAKKYFGTETPMGQTLRIDTLDYQVRGIIKDYPPHSSFRYQMYLPLSARHANPESRQADEMWGGFSFLTFVKLPAASDPEHYAEKMTDIMTFNHKRGNAKIGLIGLKEMHFEDDIQSSRLLHGHKKTVDAFTWLGGILLAIACINYVNLTTARASLRQKEIGVKKIVGAGKVQLFMQFICESLLMSFFALLGTILMIVIAVPFFNEFVDNNFSFSLTDISVLKLYPAHYYGVEQYLSVFTVVIF